MSAPAALSALPAPVAALLAMVAALAFYALAYTAYAGLRWPAAGRKVRAHGARVHVIERGAGALVLCLHGASANAREWTPAVAPLLEADHRLLLMDRPGLGHSSRPRGAERLQVQARLAAAAIESAQTGPAVVLAHSMGGATALRLALDRPDLVAGLVLVAPASHPYPGPNAWHARWAAHPVFGWAFCALLVPWAAPLMAKGAVRRVFAPAPAPRGYASAAGVGLGFRPGAFRANGRDVLASRSELAAQAPRYPDILAPTIVITADKDRVVSPAIHAEALARELAAVELIKLPGTGHMPHQVRPDVAAEAVRRVWAMARTADEG